MHCKRILSDHVPFASRPRIDSRVPWNALDHWPCKWINCKNSCPPELVAFRCQFQLEADHRFELHITADESYELFIDGQMLGAGPEPGDRRSWFFDTYDVSLEPGMHQIAAVVKQLGPLRAAGSVSISHGLLVATQDTKLLPLLGTGCGNWESAALPGIEFQPLAANPGDCFLIGPGYRIDLRSLSPVFLSDSSLKWSPPELKKAGVAESALYPWLAGHLLRPGFLAPQKRVRRTVWRARKTIGENSPLDWELLAAGKGRVRVESFRESQVLLDAGDYLCAFVEFDLESGRDALLETTWAEVIRDHTGKKLDRDFIDGPVRGLTDSFLADGNRRRVQVPIWRSGRYLQIRIKTQSQPLTIHDLAIVETGYPLEPEARWASGDLELDRILHTCLRTQQACAHETFFDCPYYERLQYIGDTRIQALITYCLTADARLARKAIELFLSSAMNPSGLPLAFAPSDGASSIPPFSLWLVSMVRDYAWWRGDHDRVRAWLPGLRALIDIFLSLPKEDGMFRSPFGWNFLDGALGSMAPGGMPGELSGPLNWQIVLALLDLAELEKEFGESECHARFHRHARQLAGDLNIALWRNEAGLYSDLPGRDEFSQHGQILPLLTGMLPRERREQVFQRLLDYPFEKSAGAFFKFYLFEVFSRMGRGDLIFQQLSPWRWAISNGFKAFPEYIQADTRSDCHAWSAHPLYHYFATILGIRPGSWGFKTVRIAPQPGRLTRLQGTLAHPAGVIHLELTRDAGCWFAKVELPPEIAGEFILDGRSFAIHPGKQEIKI